MSITPEAIDRPIRPKRQKSLPMAPILLPVGPDLAYPMAQMSLKMKRAAPMAAAGIGKQSPEQKSQTKVDGAISTQLQWALWALLNSYHCLQLSLAAYRPDPISGAPPLVISCPVACLCSSPKFSFMNSQVNIFLPPPAIKNPMKTISRAMRAPTMMTQPYSVGRDQAVVVAAR